MNFANDDPYALDLGDEFKGFGRQWHQAYEPNYSSEPYVRQPLYTFYSEEELCTSAVFQKHLSMSLAHKDKNIRELQNEILNYMEKK